MITPVHRFKAQRLRLLLAAVLLLLATLIASFTAASDPVAAAPADALASLVPALPTGQPVGTTIPWLAVYTGSDPASVRYQFSVGPDSSSLEMLRDYSPDNYFRWTPLEEGTYVVRVAAHHLGTNQRWQLSRLFVITSRLQGPAPDVFWTSHPLVLLYSAPPCQSGDIRVAFRPVSGGRWKYTPWKPCNPLKSSNFYVGGLVPSSAYELRHEVKVGSAVTFGPLLYDLTRSPEMTMPQFTVLDPADFRSSRGDAVLLHSINGGIYELVFPVATDLSGQVIWYYRHRDFENPAFPWHVGEYLVRPLPGGTMLLFMNYDGGFDQILREIDLVGHPLRETNVEHVNRQLAALGHDSIGFFHHEALRLPNGHTLVLGSVERILTDVQGSGPVNIVGDMIIDLDQQWQVVWAWNAFDRLDVTRKAVLDEVCTVVTVGCPPLSLGLTANDWTHANAIAYVPADGSLLLSLRNQDWIVKIDYRDGAGQGQVLWRLGQGGDFALTSSLPDPWFSHQHDLFLDGDKIILFDNGNTRCDGAPAGCNSRGQIYQVSETGRVASLSLSVDLGSYSSAFGSAQKLSNGNYHFMSGLILPDIVSHSIEVRPGGTDSFVMETEGTLYRSFRMPDLYSPILSNASTTPQPPPAEITLLPLVFSGR